MILPQEPPSAPPQGLVGSARSESEIMIQWQPPTEESQNGEIIGYIVRYRLFGYRDSPWSIRNVTKSTQRTYLINELITWKDYEIQIAAYNFKGVGSYSQSLKVKTREGVPSAAPTDVRAQALDSSTIKVWWLPPDPQKINGINQGTILFFREINFTNFFLRLYFKNQTIISFNFSRIQTPSLDR